MTDRDCTVFHFIVEGSAISDVTKIPPEVSTVLDIFFVCVYPVMVTFSIKRHKLDQRQADI